MELRQNILATLAYYDVFDLPLKAEEILKYLVNFKHLGVSGVMCQVSDKINPGLDPTYNLKPETRTLADIRKELEQLVLDVVANKVGDYYFLFDREYLIPLRQKREKIAQRKWQITKRVVWCLRFVPYVKAVFASGSLAIRNTDELSDLDVLTIVKHGRIWLSRFLILGVLALLGKRRKGTDRIAPDKICPNHFLTDQTLNIPFRSIYAAQIYANLAPIYVRDPGIIEKFKKANDWLLDYVSGWNVGNAREVELLLRISTSKFLTKITEWLFDNLGFASILEKWLGLYQSRRIERNPATHQTGGRVLFTDEQLEFHPHSIETQIIKGYNERLRKLNLPQLAIEKDSGLDKKLF